MDDNSYQQLIDWGFKCGIETHQQLNTTHKLFCRCKTQMRNGPHDGELIRHMRPTLSEMGTYDGTALMEFKTKKNVTYQLLNDLVCTYEMDDTPPFLINPQAVDIVIQLSLMFKASIVSELHVSRKQYLDGSIPTGFQRTAIIGVNGLFPLNGSNINVLQLNVEEDACREVSDYGHEVVFRTDRLSIPLIEVITAPDMKTPREAARAARVIGNTLRLSGLVRRGIGSVRQDVNVSITGGTRVELKGVPKIGLIEKLTYVEALRQHALIELKDKLQSRGYGKYNFEPEELRVLKYSEIQPIIALKNSKAPELKWGSMQINECLANTGSEIIQKALSRGWEIHACRIGGFRDLWLTDIGKGRTFADDVTGRVRVIACLFELPNFLHDGNLRQYGITEDEEKMLRKKLDCHEHDGLVIAFGDVKDVKVALNEIWIRCIEASLWVPNETRQVIKDKSGTTDFERILPGADRMYPDTDSPAMPITDDRINNLKTNLAELPWQREEKLRKLGLPETLIHDILIHPRYELFVKALEAGHDPKLVVVLISQILKHLKRNGFKTNKLTDYQILTILKAIKDRIFYREGLMDALKAYFKGEDLAALLNPGKPPKTELEESIKHAWKATSGEQEKRLLWSAGIVLRQYRGKVSGVEVVNKLKQLAMENG